MRLSDFKDEEALEVLADIMEPATALFNDPGVKDAIESNSTMVKVAALAIKNQKRAVIEIMAALNRVPVEDFHFNIFTLARDFLGTLNDPELLSFFASQEQKKDSESSGPVMVNTEDVEK